MNIDIIVGTTLGGAEYVADELAELLGSQHQVQIHLNAQLDALKQSECWIVCTSTHGAGDIPDNLQPFFDDLSEQKPALTNISYAIVAIGSSSYDTFCGAGEQFAQLLPTLGAKSLQEMLKIDVDSGELPEEIASRWLKEWQNQLN